MAQALAAAEGLDEEGRGLLEEDLRSPCTEEIAVFRAFARTVDGARKRIVVLDTAPTGHRLLLLDAAHAGTELAHIERVAGSSERAWLVGWQPNPPGGAAALRELAAGVAAAGR